MNGGVEFRNKQKQLQQKDSSSASENAKFETKINFLREVNPGDHIILTPRDDPSRFCHVIITGIEYDHDLIEIIYFGDGTEFLADLCKAEEADHLPDYSADTTAQSGVKKNLIWIDLLKLNLFRFDYEFNKCLPIEETLEKAEKCVGKLKYNAFVNNDEHFCIYTKTGKAAKLFILSQEVSRQKIVEKSFGNLSNECVKNLATQGGQIMLVNTAKHVATSFPRSAVGTALPEVASAACGGLGAGIEAISTGYDIYKKNKEYREGKCNTLKFKKYVATRVTRGTMAATGGVVGGIIGQMVIPIPVAGAVIGSVLGGLTGAATGQIEGLLLGELVELIDDKIRNKNRAIKSKEDITTSVGMSESLTESMSSKNSSDSNNSGGSLSKTIGSKNSEETNISNDSLTGSIDYNQTKSPENKYHVLHHLVFKFDKNILNPENFEHLPLPGKSVFYTKITDSNPFNHLILKANQSINEEDYEIYLVNDESNEMIVDLDLRASIAENGKIMNRHSVEEFSADQLPSDINIFFKYTDVNEPTEII